MPQAVVTLGFARVSGTATHTRNIGTWADAVGFDPAVTGTMWCAPICLPTNFDTSRPATVRALLNCAAANALPGLQALFRLRTVRIPTTGTPLNVDVDHFFPIPNPWVNDDCVAIDFDDGSGASFPPQSFEPDDLLGLSLSRLPADPGDNYPSIVAAAASLSLIYFTRCPVKLSPLI